MWRVVVRAKPGIITPSRRRGNHGVHRTDTIKRCAKPENQEILTAIRGVVSLGAVYF
jgi:hypothetical protein